MAERGSAVGRRGDVPGIRKSVRFALGPDVQSHNVSEVSAKDLAELRLILEAHPSSAEGGSYICASAMRNGVRNLANALPTRILLVDFDALTRQLWNAVKAVLREWGIACAYWRTRRSTSECPRRKLFVLLDHNVDADDYKRVHDAFVTELSRRAGVDVVVDPSGAQPAQPQFTPMAGVEINILSGKPFAVPPSQESPNAENADSKLNFETDKSRNVDLTSVAGWLRFKGCTPAQIYGALAGLNKTLPKPLKAREIKGIAQSVGRYQPGEALAELVIKPLSEIPVEKLKPLWPGKFWLGKVTIVAGLMGVGKSTLLFDVAARVTTAAPWPDDSGNAPLGDVVILSTEDGAADTIRPRLEVMKADISRVHILQGVEILDAKTKRTGRRLFSLRQHIDLLDQKLSELKNVRLVVIDPITGVFQGADTHKTADVREVLAMVNIVVERHQAAFVGISHPNKAEGSSAAYRITGSLAFTAAPRSAFIVGRSKDQKTPDRVVFAELKNNLAVQQHSLAFRVIGKKHPIAGDVAAIEWLGPADETPDEILDPSRGSRLRGVQEKTKTAVAWLKELLTNGPVPAARVIQAAGEARISRRQLKRAEEALKVTKAPAGRGGAWVWSLPPSPFN